MFRLFLSFQACLLVTALAQPIDARDSLIYPTNPPQPASPPRVSASTTSAQNSTAPSAPSVLKIRELDIAESDNGAKEFKATFAHGGSEQLDAADTRIVLFLYETDRAGILEITDSKLDSQWTSPPVDWDENDETLILRYTAPSVDSGKKYAGYILGIYYKDQLQDSRASSPELLQKFPLQASEEVVQLLPVAASTSASATAEPDRFIEAYKSFKDAELAFTRGDMDRAKEAVQKSRSMLEALQKDSPDWQPRIVEYRIATAEKLDKKITGN